MEYSSKRLQKVKDIESVYTKDVGSRGTERLAQATQGDLLGATNSIIEHREPIIVIGTGFSIKTFDPKTNTEKVVAETDGPVGSALLLKALTKINIKVRILTDEFCLPVIKTACKAAEVLDTIDFDVMPLDCKSNSHSFVTDTRKKWEENKVSHIISIERPCPAFDDKVYNMKGIDITNITPPLHLLFEDTKAIKIGIGDGGNECFMGKIKDEIHTNIPDGPKICPVSSGDYLLVSGVSNWGAYALIGTLSLLKPEWKNALIECLTPELDEKILRAIVNEGAVDGITKIPGALTVDGLELSEHHEILEQILNIINN